MYYLLFIATITFLPLWSLLLPAHDVWQRGRRFEVEARSPREAPSCAFPSSTLKVRKLQGRLWGRHRDPLRVCLHNLATVLNYTVSLAYKSAPIPHRSGPVPRADPPSPSAAAPLLGCSSQSHGRGGPRGASAGGGEGRKDRWRGYCELLWVQLPLLCLRCLQFASAVSQARCSSCVGAKDLWFLLLPFHFIFTVAGARKHGAQWLRHPSLLCGHNR